MISRRIAGRMDLTRQVHLGLAITFAASLVRVILHLGVDPLPIPLQQALLFCAAHRRAVRVPGAHAAHARPVPGGARHRGVRAILRRAAGHRVHARHRLARRCCRISSGSRGLRWRCTSLASLCWYLARRWQSRRSSRRTFRYAFQPEPSPQPRSRARMRPPGARRRRHRDRVRSSARSLAGVRPVTRRSSRVACAWSAKPLSAASSEMLASPASSARSVACRRIRRANSLGVRPTCSTKPHLQTPHAHAGGARRGVDARLAGARFDARHRGFDARVQFDERRNAPRQQAPQRAASDPPANARTAARNALLKPRSMPARSTMRSRRPCGMRRR